ncbi:Fatty acid desaturase [Belliella baltica DSM 15883]|uniref:Fatty acid desaturase n=1 Tax=Belliella baltica (strain DSM 15883 / CIP 108006 / LMG 21964 / BA134) TaxID=866536 RepID=I3ZA35_BELBD|nr:alkane 1-monooxygenase [Belliella baltica]AFL86103.1 Fatty acid desaturase [Belliella baltica DSM 15883]
MKDLKYLFAYSIPLSAYLALQWLGWWSWATVILAFVIFPVFDAVYPASSKNHSESEEKKRLSNRFFDLLLYICAPICFLLVFLYFQTINNTILSLNETIGLTFSIGVVLGSLGINVAHELGHRNNKWEQFLAKVGLLPVFYQHFYIEHNRGHHKHVSTDSDPATAKKNEPIYQFYLRSVIGQYLNAWKLEFERLKKKELKSISWSNEMIRFSAYQIGYLILISLYYGIGVLPYALAIGVVGFLLLETINYIEHYGLQRKKLENGRYERVMPKHSWNSDHEMGRIVLFELTRHSDHHYLASRKYQILRHMDDSPQLPTGYPASMLLALFPPLWFRIMNPRLEKFNS